MNNDKMEAVRQACIEANPGILDLVFGCEGMWHKRKNDDHELKDIKSVVLNNDIGLDIYTYEPWEKGSKNITYRTITILQDDFEIIGRRIGAIDLLKALESVPGRWIIQSSPYDDRVEFVDMNDYNKKGFKNSYFVFVGDDLSLQSPETISFLHGLLCG